MNLSSVAFLGPTMGMLIVFVISVLTLTLHIGCCCALASDANRLGLQRRGPFFLTSYQWAIAGLLTGVIALGIYWAIHHSTLSTLQRAPSSEHPTGNGLLDRLEKHE